MKLVKILIVLFVFTCSAFAKSGLEIGVFVPLGMGISVHSYDKMDYKTTAQSNAHYKYMQNNTRSSFVGFESGLLFQAGYKLDVNKKLSFSFLGELGYSRDTFNYKLKDSNEDSQLFKMNNYQYYTLDSFVLGLLPKLNYDKFSVGIGFGMKIFLGGTKSYASYNPALGYGEENILIINTKNYKDYFLSNIIPYLKFTFDYSIYTDKKFDIVVGGYVGGDFVIKYQEKNTTPPRDLPEMPIENLSSFDIGFQIGAKIRPL